MQRRFIILFLSGFPLIGFSQDYSWNWVNDVMKNKPVVPEKETTGNNSPKERLVTYEIIDGDTIPVIYLPDMVVMDQESKKKYDKTLYYVKRMYPYAKLIAKITHDYDSTLAELEKRKQRKNFIDEQKDIAMAQFESAVKNMSIGEGKCLVKLIHRECGETAYDVISKYLGSTKTFLWQAASRLGGADLKIEYDPKGEDRMMEEITAKIDKGEIKVKKLRLDPNAIEKKEKAEALAKQKKKEEKQNKKSEKKSG